MKKRESLTSIAFREIYHRILNGTYQSGEKLSIRTISESLGIGTSPVVNALNQLSSLGLVETKPQSGTYVMDMSLRKMREVIEVRKMMEISAIKPAIKFVDYLPNRAKLDEMQHFAETYAEKLEVEGEFVTELDQDFHYLYISLVANSSYLDLYKRVYNPIMIYIMQTIRANIPKSYLEQAAREHLEIVQGLRDKDEKRLLEIFNSHFDLALRMLEWWSRLKA